MSADIWLLKNGEQVRIDGTPDAEFRSMYPMRSPSGWDSDSVNVTYNLSPMLWAAGMPPWREMMGMPADEAGAIWEGVFDELRRDPETYKTLNPPNGWGDYDGLLIALAMLVGACRVHPDATVSGSL